MRPAEDKILTATSTHRDINLGVQSGKKFKKKAPIDLTPEQKLIWDDLVSHYDYVLTDGDVPAFKKLVILESYYNRANMNEDISQVCKIHDKLVNLYREFGGTPVARTRLPGPTVPHRQAKKMTLNELDDYRNNPESLLTH